LNDKHINEIKIKALNLALNAKDIDTVAILIQSLVKTGATVTALDSKTLFKVMHFAVTQDNMELIKSCLEIVKDKKKKIELLNKKDERGKTLLSIAMKARQVDMGEYLLSQGANVTPQKIIYARLLTTDGSNSLENKRPKQFTVYDDQQSLDRAVCLLQISRRVSFKLSNTSINFIEHFFDAIAPYSTYVVDLAFENCHLNNFLTHYLAQLFLGPRSSLELLWFSNVVGGPDMVRTMARMLKQNTSLEELYMGNCELNSEDASDLADMLIVNGTLSTLHLPRNHMGNQGAYYMSYALENGAKISSLGLSLNNISRKGCEELAKSLYHNMALQKLILFGNEISKDTQVSIDCSLARNMGPLMSFSSHHHNNATLKQNHVDDDRLHKRIIAVGKAAKIFLLWHQNQMPAFIKCIENIKVCYENGRDISDEDINKIKSFSNLHNLLANFEIDKKNYEIFHVLFIRMVEEGNIKTMDAFINNKFIDPSYVQNWGAGNDQITILSKAAYFGHAQLVKLFIAKGVDCNTTDTSFTPFMWAIRRGHVDVVKTFLHEKRFDELIKNENDEKKLNYALVEYRSFDATRNQINKEKYEQIIRMITHSRTSSVNDNVIPRMRRL
jgi:ankyrin repeat protein